MVKRRGSKAKGIVPRRPVSPGGNQRRVDPTPEMLSRKAEILGSVSSDGSGSTEWLDLYRVRGVIGPGQHLAGARFAALHFRQFARPRVVGGLKEVVAEHIDSQNAEVAEWHLLTDSEREEIEEHTRRRYLEACERLKRMQSGEIEAVRRCCLDDMALPHDWQPKLSRGLEMLRHLWGIPFDGGE